jgi:hypothetical protein
VPASHVFDDVFVHQDLVSHARERRKSHIDFRLPVLLQQRLRFPQIARVEAFSEPAVNRSKQFASLLHLPLVAPEACEAHCGAQLGLLLTCDRERTFEI